MTELNSAVKAQLDISTSGSEPTWGDLGNAFYSVSQSMGEKLYTASYLGGDGFSENEVVGYDYTITFLGDYKTDDSVVSYLFSEAVLFGTGSARNTKLKLTKNGKAVTWNAVMTKIRETGGNADEPNKILLELKCVGKPTVTAVA